MDQQTQPVGQQGGDGKMWLIILALVILVGVVLFLMKVTNAPTAPTTPTTGTEQGGAPTTMQDVDNTASIEQQLKNINIGDIADDMKPINEAVNSVQ